MFTGLVTDLGTVRHVARQSYGLSLTIETNYPVETLELGESIACNGVCLTVTKIEPGAFSVDLSHETLRVTTFDQVSRCARLHLERALCVGDRLGGHYVTGHVDAVGIVKKVIDLSSTITFTIQAPKTFAPLLVSKGSVAVDGVSLTLGKIVDKPDAVFFEITIIPFTSQKTIFSSYQQGQRVNLEGDLFGKYVLRQSNIQTVESGLSMQKLTDFGFT